MKTKSFSENDWLVLHDAIQVQFRALATEVIAPSIEPQFGRSSSQLFPLFSHMSFPVMKSGKCCDIILGIDIALKNEQWRIIADLSDEEGTLYFELPLEPFYASTFDELTTKTLRAAEDLCKQSKPAIQQLLVAGTVAPMTNRTGNNIKVDFTALPGEQQLSGVG